jgi:hypothetical protein
MKTTSYIKTLIFSLVIITLNGCLWRERIYVTGFNAELPARANKVKPIPRHIWLQPVKFFESMDLTSELQAEFAKEWRLSLYRVLSRWEGVNKVTMQDKKPASFDLAIQLHFTEYFEAPSIKIALPNGQDMNVTCKFAMQTTLSNVIGKQWISPSFERDLKPVRSKSLLNGGIENGDKCYQARSDIMNQMFAWMVKSLNE